MQRRSFLAAMLAAAAAPAIVRAESLMKLPSAPKIIVPGRGFVMSEQVGVSITNRRAFEQFFNDGSNWIVDTTNGQWDIDADGNTQGIGQWRVEPATVESQITTDRWYTPPEFEIRARPVIKASEIDMFDPAVDRAVAQLRELEIKRHRVPHRPKPRSLLDLARDAVGMKIRT